MKKIEKNSERISFLLRSFVTVTCYNILQNKYLILIYFLFLGRTAFEKLTELDYKGTTYYTVKNLTLYECQGWCREEPECQAASFR